jgi:hypothetical protein
MRFETPPGQQMQIDFGEKRIEIGGAKVRVYIFVATLGYSRRTYAAAVLLDNAAALVTRHDAVTREVVFNDRLHAFSRAIGASVPVLVHHTGRAPRARTSAASGM